MAKGLNARQIKIVACISMMFSHIGFIFWPEQRWWQIPGRIAFPIFAFMIANGARYSQNVWKYLARLLIFAALIQYPYSIFLGNGFLNICFTLGLGLAAIVAWQSNLHLPTRQTAIMARQSSLYLLARLLAALAVLVACLTANLLHVEYGWYGVMMIFCAHIFFADRRKLAISWAILNMPYLLSLAFALLDTQHMPYLLSLAFALLDTQPRPSIQGLCLLALPFVLLYNGRRGGGNRWEFYAFYIGHLALLYALRNILWGY